MVACSNQARGAILPTYIDSTPPADDSAVVTMAIFALLLAAQTAAPAQPAPPKPILVCREGEREVGSHIRSGRRCKTAEEWAKEDAEREQVAPSARITEGQGDSLTNTSPH